MGARREAVSIVQRKMAYSQWTMRTRAPAVWKTSEKLSPAHVWHTPNAQPMTSQIRIPHSRASRGANALLRRTQRGTTTR